MDTQIKNNIYNKKLESDLIYDFNQLKKNKLEQLEKEINFINKKIIPNNYLSLIMKNYILWINNIRKDLIDNAVAYFALSCTNYRINDKNSERSLIPITE